MFSSATAAYDASSIEAALVVGGERAGPFVENFERTQSRTVWRDERHAEDRFRAIAGLLVDRAIDLLFVVLAADTSRLAGLNHLADDAGIVGQPQLAASDSQRRSADDRFVRLVPQEDARPVGFEQSRRGFGHAHEQRFHVVRLMPLMRDVEDRLQPFDARDRAAFLLDDGECVRQADSQLPQVATSGQLPRTMSTYSGSAIVPGWRGAPGERRRQPPAAGDNVVLFQRLGREVQRHGRSSDAADCFDRPMGQRRASNRRGIGRSGGQNQFERGLQQVGDVANLARQVEQVRYDVWHWRGVMVRSAWQLGEPGRPQCRQITANNARYYTNAVICATAMCCLNDTPLTAARQPRRRFDATTFRE